MLRRSAFAARKKNSHKADAWKRIPAFLQWLRGRPCRLVEKGGCEGRIEACHIDYAGDKGMATKVSDKWAIPMCSEHHRVQHNVGWRIFEENFKFDALEDAKAYFAAWPGRAKWELERARDGG